MLISISSSPSQHMKAIKKWSLMNDQHFKAYPAQLDIVFPGATSTGVQERDFTSWNILECNSKGMLYRESTGIKSRIRSLQMQQHRIIPNLWPKGMATQGDRMCWCRCTALRDNYWTVIQEFDSRVLCLKPKEEIDTDGADKLKAKKQSSLLNVKSLREKQQTFAILLFQCRYKLQNALLSIQTDWGKNKSIARWDC